MTKALMTIHGFLTDTADFGELYDRLKDNYDYIHPCKVPGHNDQVDFKKFRVSDTIDTILSDFDKLQSQYDTVDVMGFSMGGALTTFLCARRKVNRAILLAPSNKYNTYASTTRAVMFYYNQYNAVLRNSSGSLARRIKETENFMKKYRHNNAVAMRIAFKRILPNLSTHTYKVFKELMTIVNNALQFSGNQSIHTPTLLLWGCLDELVPKSSLALVGKYFDNLKTLTYPDVGHALILTDKVETIAFDIKKFLQQN